MEWHQLLILSVAFYWMSIKPKNEFNKEQKDFNEKMLKMKERYIQMMEKFMDKK